MVSIGFREMVLKKMVHDARVEKMGDVSISISSSLAEQLDGYGNDSRWSKARDAQAQGAGVKSSI